MFGVFGLRVASHPSLDTNKLFAPPSMTTLLAALSQCLAPRRTYFDVDALLESVESVAGIVGPSIGGLLSTVWAGNGALYSVLACYASAFTLVALFFRQHVVLPAAAKGKGE